MTPLTLLNESVCVCVCEFRLLSLQQYSNEDDNGSLGLVTWLYCEARQGYVLCLTDTDMCYRNWPRVSLLSTFHSLSKHTWELQTDLKYPDLIVIPEYRMIVCECAWKDFLPLSHLARVIVLSYYSGHMWDNDKKSISFLNNSLCLCDFVCVFVC